LGVAEATGPRLEERKEQKHQECLTRLEECLPSEGEDEDEEGEEEEEGEESESEDGSYVPQEEGAREQSDSDEDMVAGVSSSSARKTPKDMGVGASSSSARKPPKDITACIITRDSSALRALLEADPHLLTEKDRLGRTPLHLALLRGEAELLQVLLAAPDPARVEKALKMPFYGAEALSKDALPLLHLSLSVAGFEKSAPAALRCLELLLVAPDIDVNTVDNTGRTVLHAACAQGASAVLDTLLRHRADPGVRDEQGSFALHYAIDSQSHACVERLLRVSDPTLFTGELHPFYRCIDRQAWGAAFLLHRHQWPMTEDEITPIFDFASARGLTTEWNFVCEKGVDNACSLEELQWPAETFGTPSTLVVTHPLCLSHGIIPDDVDDPSLRQRIISETPENPHRLETLCGERGVLKSDAFRDLRWVGEPAPAPLTDVLRVHEYWYVHQLMERVQLLRGPNPYQRLPVDGGDTKVTSDSWNAALRACGCVLEAVDQVCNEQVRNAFCAVRPPGHHLGPAGATDKQDLDDDPEGSQGFCLLNNVAVGAAYARCVYRHMIHKVAIIDFDIHHGNGTEAIVRHLKCKLNRVDKVETVSLRGFSTRISVNGPPTCKPWLDPESDAESVFFASVHGYGGGFYPGTGRDCNEASPKIVNVAMRPDSSSADFRQGFRSKVLPELKAFDPDLIFVSAGFDGHEDDLIGNSRLVEEDFVWVTQQLLSVANSCCQGRLISVLEGGYNSRAECLSPFARSVAAHVRTLMHTSPNYRYLEVEAQAGGEPGAAEGLPAGGSFRQRDEQWVARRIEAKNDRRRKRRLSGSSQDGGPNKKKAKLVLSSRIFAAATAAAASAGRRAEARGDIVGEPEAIGLVPKNEEAELKADERGDDAMRNIFGEDDDEDGAAEAVAESAVEPAVPAALSAALAVEPAAAVEPAVEPAVPAAGVDGACGGEGDDVAMAVAESVIDTALMEDAAAPAPSHDDAAPPPLELPEAADVPEAVDVPETADVAAAAAEEVAAEVPEAPEVCQPNGMESGDGHGEAVAAEP